jgi:hypothetical protein
VITMPAALMPSLAVVTMGVALTVAVAAPAAAIPDCTNTGPTTTQCERPGNAQINTSPGYNTYDNYPWGFPWGSGITISLGGWGF